MTDVIYLCAGQGVRAKLGYPKQLAMLCGKPIMVYALEVFNDMPEISRIVITLPPGDPESATAIRSIAESYKIDKAVYVDGGATRQLSVCSALNEVKTPDVLIHEAVRPFITAAFVRDILSHTEYAVSPWRPNTSTTICLSGLCFDRTHYGEVQMPQKYNTYLLRRAHDRAVEHKVTGYTDDAALVVIEVCKEILVVPGLEENIKITTPLDLKIAEAIHNAKFSNGE